MIDIHGHLATAAYDADRPAMLQRARNAGVTAMICIGAGDNGLYGNERALALAEQEPDVYAAIGIHPHDAAHWNADVAARIAAMAACPRVVAVGEIGMDFFGERPPLEQQRTAFHAQMDLALALDKPIQIHQRDAAEQMFACFAERAQIPRGVIHCFTGAWDLAERFLTLGFSLSIPGVVTFKKCDDVRAMVAQIPLDRLLLETDCPYLAPMPYRGKRCEPAFMVETAKVIAGLHNLTLEQLVEQTDANTRALFGVS